MSQTKHTCHVWLSANLMLFFFQLWLLHWLLLWARCSQPLFCFSSSVQWLQSSVRPEGLCGLTEVCTENERAEKLDLEQTAGLCGLRVMSGQCVERNDWLQTWLNCGQHQQLLCCLTMWCFICVCQLLWSLCCSLVVMLFCSPPLLLFFLLLTP